MTELTYLFATVAVLAGAMTMITVWAPRTLIVKLGAIAAATAFLGAGYLGLLSLLSRPKPVDMEWWLATADQAAVLGSRIEEGRAIYLWLQFEATPEPRAYALPWDRDLAEQLQTATRDAAEHESQLVMRNPFEPSLDRSEPQFYAMPQRPMPAKTRQAEPARRVPRERGDAA